MPFHFFLSLEFMIRLQSGKKGAHLWKMYVSKRYDVLVAFMLNEFEQG